VPSGKYDHYRIRGPNETRTCAAPGCNNTFECKVVSAQKYCSKSCIHKGRGKLRETRICAPPGCNTAFECRVDSKRKYCCLTCSNRDRSGENNPSKRLEVRKKIGKAMIGKTLGEKNGNWKGGPVELVCQWCGKKFFTGQSRKNIAKYCSVSCSGKGYAGKNVKEKNGNWKGGVMNLPYSIEFRSSLKNFIRTRDHNTCQLCRKTKVEEGKNLAVHHINYDKEDSFELNLISLCSSCNGKVNNNKKMWEDYFTFWLLHGIMLR